MIINGKSIAEHIKREIKTEVDFLKEKSIIPSLVAILVGNDPASEIYVRMKETACKNTGISSRIIRLPENTTENELLRIIDELNCDTNINAILVQLPLPMGINPFKIIPAIDPNKDADGFHPYNVGNLLIGSPTIIPATPYGIIRLLEKTGIEFTGKDVVIIGASNIVGKPLAALLLNRACTVTICHKDTKNITKFTKDADIIISATGIPGFLKGDNIKKGAVVIDVGITRVPADNAKGFIVTGDADFQSCFPIASYITPVPKGVGPMTIAMLLYNTLYLTKKQHKLLVNYKKSIPNQSIYSFYKKT